MSFFLFRWIKNLFGKEGVLKRKVIPEVIKVVNSVKEFDTLNPEFADLLTSLIPGTADDELKEKIRAGLKLGLEKLGEFNTCLTIENEDERYKCIITQLQAIADKDVKIMKWTELAAYITKSVADDERLDIAEIAVLVKMVYNKDGEPDEDDDNED